MDDGKSEWRKKKERLNRRWDKCRKGVVDLFGTLHYNPIYLKKIASVTAYIDINVTYLKRLRYISL